MTLTPENLNETVESACASIQRQTSVAIADLNKISSSHIKAVTAVKETAVTSCQSQIDYDNMAISRQLNDTVSRLTQAIEEQITETDRSIEQLSSRLVSVAEQFNHNAEIQNSYLEMIFSDLKDRLVDTIDASGTAVHHRTIQIEESVKVKHAAAADEMKSDIEKIISAPNQECAHLHEEFAQSGLEFKRRVQTHMEEVTARLSEKAKEYREALKTHFQICLNQMEDDLQNVHRETDSLSRLTTTKLQAITESEKYRAKHGMKLLAGGASETLSTVLGETKVRLEETAGRFFQMLDNHQPIERLKLKVDTTRVRIDSNLRMLSERCAEIAQSESDADEKMEPVVKAVINQFQENLTSIKETYEESILVAFNGAKDNLSRLAAKAEEIIKTTHDCARQNMVSISEHQHKEIRVRTDDLLERVGQRQEIALALVLESSAD